MTAPAALPALRAAPAAPALRAPRLGGRDAGVTGAGPSDAAMRQAVRAFETPMLGLMLHPIFATADPSRSRFGGGAAEAQWRPMLVDAYAAATVRAGGFGIADLVLRQLRRAATPPSATPGSPPP